MAETLRPPRAAYAHIPFCISKCHYCDFDSFAGLEALFDQYVRAVIAEIGGRQHATGEAGSSTPLGMTGGVDSVYIGGGTPTVLLAEAVVSILRALDLRFGIEPGAEVTIEANPGTVDERKLAQLRAGGFNRISLGVQSFDDNLLTAIGRAHNARDAAVAYEAARGAGFTNVGIDLIFALPDQSVSRWETTLDTAIGLGPEHISLYELTIEQGTRFARMCAEGLLELPDEETKLEMYETAIGKTASAGYEHYEVSNFARPGFRSRHNQVYWRNEPFYGFGAGATSYVGGVRSHRMPDPRAYVEAVESGEDAVDFREELSGRARLGETVILGLRMLEGVDLDRVRADRQADVVAEFADEIAELTGRGLVELQGGWLRVTHQGLLLLNDVSQAFV